MIYKSFPQTTNMEAIITKFSIFKLEINSEDKTRIFLFSATATFAFIETLILANNS